MIPKIIHYCWFGGTEIPERDRKCIESWKKFCPDYEIVRWDESNYDYKKNRYMREAYEAKKWGFVSDFARLDIVYEYGGIYLDTDVELVMSLDDLLENRAFMGFDSGGINCGIGFGAEKNFPLLKDMLNEIYADRVFKLGKGDYNTTPCNVFANKFLEKHGLVLNNRQQKIEGMTVYPSDWFSPIDFSTGEFCSTENTHSIHYYNLSWLTPEEKKILSLRRKLTKKHGAEKGKKIAEILGKPYRLKMHLRTKGVRGTISFAIRKLRLGIKKA